MLRPQVPACFGFTHARCERNLKERVHIVHIKGGHVMSLKYEQKLKIFEQYVITWVEGAN